MLSLSSIVALLGLCSLTAAIAATSEFEQLEKEAGRNISTDEGQRYLEQFTKAIMPVFGSALNDCKKKPDTKEPAAFFFIVATDGGVKRLLYSHDIPFGVCVGSKLRTIKTLPKPPRDSWVVAFGAANHHHEEQGKGPPDTPLKMTKKKLAAYDRAIAPYIAKARATYPDAKRRFLAGLPRGYRFSVRVPLFDADGKREDSFIAVEKISDGKITGTIST